MIYKEERSPINKPFLFYWRVTYGINKKSDEYMCIRGVVNYFRDQNSAYDGILIPYSSPYTCMFRLYRYGRFFDISNPETLFLPIYHGFGFSDLKDHKEEVLKDCAEIKLKIEEKYQILYGKIPNKGEPFSLKAVSVDCSGKIDWNSRKELVEKEDLINGGGVGN